MNCHAYNCKIGNNRLISDESQKVYAAYKAYFDHFIYNDTKETKHKYSNYSM